MRLRSSFIYLANAVNDLRGNWTVLAIVLAPMVLAAALCLLPDALNLQFRLATAFEPGTQNISYQHAPTADAPDKSPPVLKEQQPYSPWITTALHLLFALISVLVTLVALCSLARIQAGAREAAVTAEAVEVYRRAFALAPAFLWITFLQLLAPAAGLFLFQAAVNDLPNSVGVVVYIGLVLMIIVGALLYLWLYFAQFALVFDGKHSWHALLFSRDLMRKRFFKVATRIVVFLAVWSGFNSWAAGSFVVVSLLFGPVGVVTGFLGTTIFFVDFTSIAVSFATAAFFVAAGLRLYQDLIGAPQPERAESATQLAMQPTAALS